MAGESTEAVGLLVSVVAGVSAGECEAGVGEDDDGDGDDQASAWDCTVTGAGAEELAAFALFDGSLELATFVGVGLVACNGVVNFIGEPNGANLLIVVGASGVNAPSFDGGRAGADDIGAAVGAGEGDVTAGDDDVGIAVLGAAVAGVGIGAMVGEEDDVG